MIADVIIVDGARQPNIDDNIYAGWSVLKDFGSTMEVEVTKRPEIVENENEALKAASQFVIAKELLLDAIPEDEIEKFASLYDYPVSGQTYKLDWVLRDLESGELFRIVQPQVTWESHWKIAEIPAIATPFRKPNTITPWVQPSGAQDAYNIGDKVSYNESNWESKIDANATVPDGDIPFNRYWNPL